MSNLSAEKKVAPLRDVRSEKLNYPLVTGAFRVLQLSCGHVLIRQPAQKIPKKARCQECTE